MHKKWLPDSKDGFLNVSLYKTFGTFFTGIQWPAIFAEIKEEYKDQESIQSNTTADPRHQKHKKVVIANLTRQICDRQRSWLVSFNCL